MKIVAIEIISIGDEILIGQIVNTNAAFLSEGLTGLGGSVRWITTVGDNPEDIRSAIEIAIKRADIVIATGGLGPTHDDITKKVIAKFFDTQLVVNENVLQNITAMFRKMGRNVDSLNKEQALVPECATILPNPVGTAPGLLFTRNSKQIFVLPGVPYEMKAIFNQSMTPLLKKAFEGIYIKYKTIKTTGLFESRLFKMVQDILPKIEDHVQVAFLPTFSGVNIRLGTQDIYEAACVARIQFAESLFLDKIGAFVYSTDERNIQDVVTELLNKANKTLSAAEFYTEGYFATTFLKARNSRKCFKGSKVLAPEILQEKAIADQKSYCIALAQNARDEFNSDYGISIIEFPDEPRAKENLSTAIVYFGLVSPDFKKVESWRYRKERPDIKQRAVQFVLDMIRKEISAIKDD